MIKNIILTLPIKNGLISALNQNQINAIEERAIRQGSVQNRVVGEGKITATRLAESEVMTAPRVDHAVAAVSVGKVKSLTKMFETKPPARDFAAEAARKLTKIEKKLTKIETEVAKLKEAPEGVSSKLLQLEREALVEVEKAKIDSKLLKDVFLEDLQVELIKHDTENIRLTAREVVVENPYTIKHYLNEIEELTKIGAVHEKQLPLLKESLKKQEFVKLNQEQQLLHRKEFDKIKQKLKTEWEQETGQKWPAYENNYYSKQGVRLRKIGEQYDAHHIVQSNHGGPNTWWNIHPAHFLEEHKKIHRAGSIANQIFNSKIKK